MKRLLFVLTVCLVALVVSPVFAGKEVTIQFWHPFGEPARSVVLDQISKFNNTVGKEKGIAVQYSFVPTTAGSQSSEKLLSAIAAGNPPDVAHFDRFVVGSWAARGSLTDISDLARAAGVTADQYFKFSWEEASYDGKLYALPHDTDDRGLYWNKKLFSEAGLDPEQPPIYTDELDAMAEKLTKKDASGRLTQIGFVPWLNQGWLYTWGWAFGGSFYDTRTKKITANDPKIIAALDWMASYAKKYGTENIESFTTSMGSQALDPFFTGQIAMKSDGDWFLFNIQQYSPDLRFGVSGHPYPRSGGEKNSTWAGGWAGVIPKGAKNPKEAWEFLRWFYGDAQAEYAIRTFHIPTHLQSAKDPELYKDPNHAFFMSMLPNAHWRPVIPEGNLLWVELRDAREFATAGKKTAKQALDDVTRKVQEALSKFPGYPRP